MLEQLNLRGVGPAPELSFDFSERFNVLTGDNGVGKSFILDVAWWVVSRNWVERPAIPRYIIEGRRSKTPAEIEYRFVTKTKRQQWVGSTFDRKTQTWWVPQGRPPAPGMVIFARLDGGFSLWDPLRNYWKKAPSLDINEPTRPSAYQFSRKSIWDGLVIDDKIVCNGIIRDLEIWSTNDKAKIELFNDILAALSPDETEKLALGPLIRLDLDDVRRVPTIKFPYGTIPLPIASEAIQRMVGLAYLLIWAFAEHDEFSKRTGTKSSKRVLLLVDEIEAHLHPRWQRKILPSLRQAVTKLSKNSSIQILAVTHSPLVLASLESTFDPEQDSLFNFVLEGKKVSAKQLEWRTRGDVGAWLTSEVFNLGEARSLEAEKAIKQARETARNPDATTTDFKTAHKNLQRVLGDTDPFWVRWVARAERAGLKL